MVSTTNKSILAKAKKGISLIRKGHIKTLFVTLIKRIYSNNLCFGLSRDMRKKIPP
jgi:hypothetical protein